MEQELKKEKKFHYITYLLLCFFRPYHNFKEHEEKLGQMQTSLIVTLLMAICLTIGGAFRSLFYKAVHYEFDFSKFSLVWNYDSKRLSKIDYWNLFGTKLLIYLAIILALAVIYIFVSFLIGLITKKPVHIARMLSATASSFGPYILFTMILAHPLSLLWFPLLVMLSIVGFVYSLVLFITLINDTLEDLRDSKVWIHLICICTIIFSGLYFGYQYALDKITQFLDLILSFLS